MGAAENYVSKERFAQKAITRGLEQASNTEKLYNLYERYCATGSAEYLNDIILVAERLGMNIAFARLAEIPHFSKSDFEDCLQELSAILFRVLEKDYKEGTRQRDIVWTIRSIYRKKTISIIRKFWRSNPTIVSYSIDEMNETEDGKTVEVIGGADDTPWYDPEDLFIRTDLHMILYRMYLNTMLRYNGEPQKVLSMCYARVLYHLELRYDPYEIEYLAAAKYANDDRTTISDQEKWIEAIQETQNETKATSVKWARKKMEGKTIQTLLDESEYMLQKSYDPDLIWGPEVCSYLNIPSRFCGGLLWGAIRYTELFSESDTTAWAQSIHNSVADSVCKQICENPELEKLVMQYNSPIRRRLIRKTGEGRENNAPYER